MYLYSLFYLVKKLIGFVPSSTFFSGFVTTEFGENMYKEIPEMMGLLPKTGLKVKLSIEKHPLFIHQQS